MIDVVTHIDEVGIIMDLSDLYPLPHLSYTRTIKHKVKDSRITLLESITAQKRNLSGRRLYKYLQASSVQRWPRKMGE